MPQYVAQFNGATSIIDAGNSASLNPTSAVTVSAWIRVTTFTHIADIVSKYQDLNTGSWYMSLGTGAPYNNIWAVVIDSTGNYLGGTHAATLTAGTWTHVVLIYGGGKALTIYVNGVGQQFNPATYPIMSNQQQHLYIGSGDGSNGLISNVQIYNTSFDPAHSITLYGRDRWSPYYLNNLVGWIAPSNGNTNDNSGNNNNGAPTNIIIHQFMVERL